MAAEKYTRKNVWDIYSDRDFLTRYRLDKDGVRFVTNLIEDDISPVTFRNRSVSPVLKVLVALRYFATGEMQLCNADDFGLSQPSVSRIINQIITALVSPDIIQRFIKFPTNPQNIIRNERAFCQIAQFPKVVGAIDGTHVRIVAPSVNEEVFVNRKNYHSINTQVVFDPFYRIIDAVANWPGSTHDARILRESSLFAMFENGRIPPGTHLLGDSGYPSKPWLLTPYLRPNPDKQSRYNRAHKRTRSLVERGIGQMKRRFYVLHSEIRLSPEKACKVIMCCAVLHNICKDRNVPMPEEMDDEEEERQLLPPPPAGNINNAYRDEFVQRNF